ncbi:hypothetical protein BU17DRAFT_69929 [Hysterangium stoloniferum]|nr:hypothetical protein BU17DRAFT_69929 [Hysterangium stoloniferum]
MTENTRIQTQTKSNVACPLDKKPARPVLKENAIQRRGKLRRQARMSRTFRFCGEEARGDDRMRPRRTFSSTPGDKSEEPLMDDEARLGKEDAGAVGLILEEDRRKEDVVEVVMENGFTF